MQDTSARALPPGTVIAGDWRVERMLGEGGFAVTYEARNTRTGEHVALKEYMPAGCCHRAPGSSQITASTGKEGEVFHWGRERFMKEAETLARLDHPSIVRVAGYFEANGTAYMALAYEAGGTLKSWLQRLGRPPTQAELDAILWPLLDALKEVHSLFLLHRDIKPDNILMRGDGTPVLIDFGATRSAIVGHTQAVGGVNPAATSAFAIVSHGYSPPEQYDPAGRMVGPVSDVYALAATLYASLTGAPPPTATSRHFNDPYQPLAGTPTLRSYRPECLAGIDQALALNPKDRPQSAVEFRRAIGLNTAPRGTSLAWRPTEVALPPGGAVGSSAPSVPPVTFTGIQSAPKRAAQTPPRSRAGLIAAGMLGMAMLGAGGWWLINIRVDPAVAKAEADRRVAEANAARLKAEAEARRLAEEKAKVEAAERQRIAELKKAEELRRQQEEAARKKAAEDEAKRKAEDEARRRDAIAALAPGSGKFARDRLANGAECAFCPEMVVVPAGTFMMGSPPTEERGSNYDGREEPVRRVTFARPFAAGRFAVMRGEFAAFVRASGHRTEGGCFTWDGGAWKQQADKSWRSAGFEQDDRHPVVCVNWEDVQAYTKWLAQQTGKTYRLLSEAEREYATRAGTTTPFWWGSSISPAQANYNGNFVYGGGPKGEFRHRTEAVESFQPNPWGLYNVHGNVWERVEDCWHANYNGAPTDGSAWITACTDASRRVVRGGSWINHPVILRSANRIWLTTVSRSGILGFRVGRTLTP